jgi:hypothetical protein
MQTAAVPREQCVVSDSNNSGTSEQRRTHWDKEIGGGKEGALT